MASPPLSRCTQLFKSPPNRSRSSERSYRVQSQVDLRIARAYLQSRQIMLALRPSAIYFPISSTARVVHVSSASPPSSSLSLLVLSIYSSSCFVHELLLFIILFLTPSSSWPQRAHSGAHIGALILASELEFHTYRRRNILSGRWVSYIG